MGGTNSKGQKTRNKNMPRQVGYEQVCNELYDHRGRNGRRGDHGMRQQYPENPGMVPGYGPWALNRPRALNPMFANPRMNTVNSGQGQVVPPPTASMDEVKKWVIETCGSQLEEATGSMKIRGIPDVILQFVVHKPATQLQAAFTDRKMRQASRLMFHGTPLPNLQPILQGGFRHGEVWVAAEPSYSFRFALKGQGFAEQRRRLIANGGLGLERFTLPLNEELLKSPYCSYGALLGCEYVEGTSISRGRGYVRRRPRVKVMGGGGMTMETSSTNDHHAVMVRYVFLIPPYQESPGQNGIGLRDFGMPRFGGELFPTRSQLKTQMLENIDNIEARIERRRREG
jgi:hypothetical protein